MAHPSAARADRTTDTSFPPRAGTPDLNRQSAGIDSFARDVYPSDDDCRRAGEAIYPRLRHQPEVRIETPLRRKDTGESWIGSYFRNRLCDYGYDNDDRCLACQRGEHDSSV